ncbi:SGNH/GDSL hydrolase family protein [Rhizobium leguminosarum]|uniref:SGNH/GDSL hydrolase family protein n=1 Tax=Rhizobium leguminosarum TaxID=384 RepID=UPI0004813182|nr:SGNH/GDSL hydrolase family protein [Rhizobium leguminosarum]
MPAAQTFEIYVYHQNRTIDDSRKQSRLFSLGGSIACFGDSNFAGLSFGDIPFAENYGISGDTLGGLIWRLRGGNYSSLGRARAIVMGCFPFNDICVTSPNLAAIEAVYASILNYFTGPLVIVPPTRTSNGSWNANIATFNTWLRSTYGARSECIIVDHSDLHDGSGAALPGYTIDGQHWASVMQTAIVEKIKAALRDV